VNKLLTILSLLITQLCFGNTIIVGPTQVISSLRKGIGLASNGDTVLLQKGVYKEGNIIINKSICLIGVDQPVLDGENKYEILTVSGNAILIKGIHFKNSGYSSMNDYASINLVDAQNVIIENNFIEHAYFAIHGANSNNCIIRNNVVRGKPKTEQTSGNAIHLWKCDHMIVEDNDLQGHRDGIYFEFVTDSYILGNKSHNNIRYGLHFMFSNKDSYLNNSFMDNGAGVAVMYSHHVLMQGNIFNHNWGPNAYGILLKEISDAQIFRNQFIQNTMGILMESTNRIDIGLNEFRHNGWALRIQASCNENNIYYNNFNGNTFRNRHQRQPDAE
jgi:nitrous oxidase accessory protein